ncbi:MAG TPA: hypothetical protein VOA87_08725 [Thermoanaerobaculia bacterium]|nr:hypothetical protein [Thermoanaerobaculia bacterium]
MRPGPVLLAAILAAGALACARGGRLAPEGRETRSAVPAPAAAGRAETVQTAPQKVDFATRIQPILEARCRPCHFPGGKVYDRMPFDRASTVLELREKLFTRIKEESQRQPIREFLAAHPATGAAGSR